MSHHVMGKRIGLWSHQLFHANRAQEDEMNIMWGWKISTIPTDTDNVLLRELLRFLEEPGRLDRINLGLRYNITLF